MAQIVVDNYGEFLFEVCKYSEALKEYIEVVRVEGEDKNATKMIFKIHEKMEDIELKKKDL